MESVLPVRDVAIRLRVDDRPSTVPLQPDSVEPIWSIQDNVLVVRVPLVDVHPSSRSRRLVVTLATMAREARARATEELC